MDLIASFGIVVTVVFIVLSCVVGILLFFAPLAIWSHAKKNGQILYAILTEIKGVNSKLLLFYNKKKREGVIE